MIFVLYICLLFYSTALNECPQYSCNDPVTIDNCSILNTSSAIKEYLITPCEFGLVCMLDSTNISSCSLPEVNSRFPGEFCYSNLDCISNNCTANICAGLPLDKNCNTSSDCNPGLFCPSEDPKFCTQQGIDRCTSDLECLNSYICDNNICVEMFSVEVNNFTTVIWPNNFAPTCASGYAIKHNETFNNCSDAPTGGFELVTCDIGDLNACKGNGDSNSTCLCAYDGNSYCTLFQGDPPALSMIETWKLLFEYSNLNCHTENRWSYACFYNNLGSSSIFNDFLNWSVNASLYLDNTWINKNNTLQCIKETFMLNYYNILDQEASILPNGNQPLACPKYTCTNYTKNWDMNQCTFYEKNIFSDEVFSSYFIHPCPSIYMCEGDILSNYTCETKNITTKYPGEYCLQGNECFSKKCLGSKCQGVFLGGKCVNPFDCQPGLYCGSNNTCQRAAQFNESCSAIPCDTYTYCLNGVCTLLYSQKIGKPAVLENPKLMDGYSPVCKSGFARTINGQVICYYPPTSSVIPRKCIPGSLCNDSVNQFSKNCECGYDGNSYCPAFEGDDYLENAIQSYTILQNTNIKCNIYSGPTLWCYGDKWENMQQYYYYYTNMTSYQNLPQLQNNDDCIK